MRELRIQHIEFEISQNIGRSHRPGGNISIERPLSNWLTEEIFSFPDFLCIFAHCVCSLIRLHRREFILTKTKIVSFRLSACAVELREMFSGPGIAGLLLTVLLFGLLCPKLTNAENILAVFSYTFGSSYLLITPFLRNLVQRGHQLTLISAVTIMPHIEGVHHIRVPKLDMLMKSNEPQRFYIALYL